MAGRCVFLIAGFIAKSLKCVRCPELRTERSAIGCVLRHAKIEVRGPMSTQEPSKTVLGEIRNSLGELRTIIDTIPALAWSSRPDCSVDFVNQRWQEYAGMSSEQWPDEYRDIAIRNGIRAFAQI